MYHQGWLSFQDPLASQFSVCPEVGFVSKEYLAASQSRLLCQGGVLHHEALPFPLISLDQSPLGTLQDEPQPMQIVQATAAAQADAESLRDKLMDHLPVSVGQFDASHGRQFLHRRL